MLYVPLLKEVKTLTYHKTTSKQDTNKTWMHTGEIIYLYLLLE